MWNINKYNEIRMTKGDTPAIKVLIMIQTEWNHTQPYIPVDGDKIIFAVAGSSGIVLKKEIPHDTMLLVFSEEDTGDLPEGEYTYEISINSGRYHCTFIPSTRFILMHEIYVEREEQESSDHIEIYIPASGNIIGELSQPGIPGLSAYEIAVRHGFEGTEEEWLESLKPSREEIDSKITAPHQASVGQILCVKSVDENGNPTEWETVDRGAVLN